MVFYYSDRIDFAGWICGAVLLGISGLQALNDAFSSASEPEALRLKASILLFVIVLGGVLWLQAYVRSTRVLLSHEHIHLSICSQAAMSMCLIHIGSIFTFTPLMLLDTYSKSIIYDLGIVTVAISSAFAAYRIMHPRFRVRFRVSSHHIKYCVLDARLLLFFDVDDGCLQIYCESGFNNRRKNLVKNLVDLGAKEVFVSPSTCQALKDYPRPSIFYLPAFDKVRLTGTINYSTMLGNTEKRNSETSV